MTFTAAQFLPHVGSQFSIPFGDGLSLTLTLDDVKDSTTTSSPYHFFSLNFSSNAFATGNLRLTTCQLSYAGNFSGAVFEN